MKKRSMILVLIFIMLSSSVIALEGDNDEIINLVREGDKAIIDAVNNQNADCQARVDERYNEFIGGIETRFKQALYIERIALIFSLTASILMVWGITGFLNSRIKKRKLKGDIKKMNIIQKSMTDVKKLLNENKFKDAFKKFKHIVTLYTSLSQQGQRQIYNDLIGLQKMVTTHGK